jgi:hypothetical protein
LRLYEVDPLSSSSVPFVSLVRASVPDKGQAARWRATVRETYKHEGLSNREYDEWAHGMASAEAALLTEHEAVDLQGWAGRELGPPIRTRKSMVEGLYCDEDISAAFYRVPTAQFVESPPIEFAVDAWRLVTSPAA